MAPYRMHVRHELLATDLPRRLRFAEWFIQRCRRKNFLPSIIIEDEAAFAMDGEVNSHNVRQYSLKGHLPVFNFERSNSRAKLTVWAALCGNGVILGPYFFDGNGLSSIAKRLRFSETRCAFWKPALGGYVSGSLVGTRRRSSSSPH